MRRGWLAALSALLCLVFLTSWAPAVFASQNVTLDFNLYGDPSLGLLTGGTTGVSLAADFVGQGLWVNGTTWGQISGWNPLRMASWTGGLAAEFGPEKGLWTYNGTSWSWLTAWKVAEVLSGWKGGLAVGFGTGTGLWNWSGSAWTQLVGGWDPTVLCGWTQGLAAGFGYGRGTWTYDGSAWKQIVGWDPALMTAWSGGLAVAFGPGTGLWNWNGTAWTQLVGGWDPLILSGWDQGIAVGFGQNRGLWNWTGSGWAWLTGWKDPLALAGWKNGLAVGFGIGTGLWNWSGASWSQVTGWDPWQLVGVSFPTQETRSTCARAGTITTNNGEHIVQNNLWNVAATGEQCVTADTTTGAFSVTTANNSVLTDGPPASYPSIYKGCHWGNCTTNSNLPIQIGSIESLYSSWDVSLSTGNYNVAYDLRESKKAKKSPECVARFLAPGKPGNSIGIRILPDVHGVNKTGKASESFSTPYGGSPDFGGIIPLLAAKVSTKSNPGIRL